MFCKTRSESKKIFLKSFLVLSGVLRGGYFFSDPPKSGNPPRDVLRYFFVSVMGFGGFSLYPFYLESIKRFEYGSF